MILAKVIQTIRLKRFPSGMSAARRLLLRSHAPESPLRSARIIAVFFQTAKKKQKQTVTSRPALWSSEKTDSAVTPLLLHVPLTWRRTEIPFVNFFFFFLLFSCFPQLGVTPSSIKPLITRRSVYPVGEATFMFTSQKKKEKAGSIQIHSRGEGGVDLKCIRSHQGLYKE